MFYNIYFGPLFEKPLGKNDKPIYDDGALSTKI